MRVWASAHSGSLYDTSCIERWENRWGSSKYIREVVSHRKGLLTSYWTHTRSRESSGHAKSDAVSKPRAAWQPQTRLHKNIVPCRHCMHRRQAGKPLGYHACDCRCDPARALCPQTLRTLNPLEGGLQEHWHQCATCKATRSAACRTCLRTTPHIGVGGRVSE